MLQRRIWIALFVLALLGTLSATDDLKRGVIVEKIDKSLEAERAGLREGDVILGWSRGESKGEIESPFDLSWIEVEQAPRGAVVLEGLRGTDKLTWTLGQNQWGVETRPDLTATALSIYGQGQELAKTGKVTEAAQRWRGMATDVQSSGSAASWLHAKAARLLADGGHWKEADEAYQAAMGQAPESHPSTLIQLDLSWGLAYQQRGDLANAEKHYQQSLARSRNLGDDNLFVAASWNSLGRLADHRGDLSAAEQCFRQALGILQKAAPESLPVAEALARLGIEAGQRGDLTKAEEYFREGLTIAEKVSPQSSVLAGILNDLGEVARNRSNLTLAEENYRRALAIAQEVSPGSLDVANLLNNLANTAWSRGDLAGAEDFYHQSLSIGEKWPANGIVARSHDGLGNVAFRREDFARAEDQYRQALDIREKLASTSLETAQNLVRLGIVAGERGDFTRADAYLQRALMSLQRFAPESPWIANVLSNLGGVAERRGDLAEAKEYLQQALIKQQKAAPGDVTVAEVFNNLGTVAQENGNLSEAEEDYRQALEIERKVAPNGPDARNSLQGLGNIARAHGDLEGAQGHYRQALEINDKLAPEGYAQAEILAALASIQWHKGQPLAAEEFFGRALNALEHQATRLGGGRPVSSNFRASHAQLYSDYVALLMTQGRPESALEVVERLRARSLLEMLAEARVDIHRGVDAELLERERLLQQTLNAKSDRRVQLLTSKHTDEQLAAVQKEIENTRAEYEQIEDRIRANSPGYAALTKPHAFSAKQIQQLLDKQTLLLEYELGDERSYLFAVTPELLAGYELPKRTTIENLARRLHTLLSKPKGKEITAENHQRLLKTTAGALSQMILGPVAGQLGGKRLLIVGDGGLLYIPFAMLPSPGKTRARTTPLLIEHEIVYAPSASVLAELRREATGRAPAPKAVAVLADPVFDNEDPRVKAMGVKSNYQASAGSNESRSLLNEHLTRSVADVGLAHLPRLAFSRREADAIIAVTPSGQGKEALGFEADRATATSQELAQYRIVHFATHALSDSRHPEFSGLVLSLVDRHGKPQDGFLDLQNIYNLNMPAELVVLSACETGLGKEIKGEGLVGLTRGFMYAGATRVVASLWNADDVSTKTLMERFYRAMEQRGARPSAALRQAQVSMWREHRWNNPYYWAAFQLQGEWK